MEQQFSTSKVTVEYFDPHDVYKLLAPGLVPRLPLRDLHWQSHAGPLRSINTLHIDLVTPGTGADDHTAVLSPIVSPSAAPSLPSQIDGAPRDDGFQATQIGSRALENVDGSAVKAPSTTSAAAGPGARRHQIPGLRRTPYLKVLLVRCDDNDTYKATTRAEIREWIKNYTPPAQKKTASTAENHDAFEWLIVHVVIPNTVAATQPRIVGKGADALDAKTASRWRGGSSTLLEKMRSDFNSTSKNVIDRVAQIRIGINDVPYDLLPRVVPAVPTGYTENEQDAENAWAELIAKFKSLILNSFDMRVTQYEEDIKERDAQRRLPGWNFCTFFILKEGLARGFESVGLVEDALVGYDELSVGLDTVLHEQAVAGSVEAHGGALLAFTEDLQHLVEKAIDQIGQGSMEFDEEAVDLQSGQVAATLDEIAITSTKKPYRELILANNVSVFDFRCYIFARQISLLLRMGNAWSTREELLARLKEQQESVLHGVAPSALPPKHADEGENLTMLAEICRRTLAFIPLLSTVMRKDIVAAILAGKGGSPDGTESLVATDFEAMDNIVASYAFSVAQQILAVTATRSLPIPPSALAPSDGQELKASIPEPKTMMHPARSSSLHVRVGAGAGARPLPSPTGFPGPGRRASLPETDSPSSQFLKAGLEELAARRAELYALSRNILEESGKKRGWSNGWASVPVLAEADMEEISLDDDKDETSQAQPQQPSVPRELSVAGVDNKLLRTALGNQEDFYRLYETLTDKALRHYTVAGHTHSVKANMTDLAILKSHLRENAAAAAYFCDIIPFFAEKGWSLLELSMLIMYADCLKELKNKTDHVMVLRKLLTKAAAAQLDKVRRVGHVSRKGPTEAAESASAEPFPESSTLSGYLDELLSTAASLDKEVPIPFSSFFYDVEISNLPTYDDGQDSFAITVSLKSLLVDSFQAKKASLRLVSRVGNREIWLHNEAPGTLRPGQNQLQLRGNIIMDGSYEVSQLVLACDNVSLHHERTIGSTDKTTSLLRNPVVSLYQRASSLNARLSAAKDVQLDKNNSLELELTTGWNEVERLELKVKSATGGLRLLMSSAVVQGSIQPSQAPEPGLFVFDAIPTSSSVVIRFPFTTEQDLMSVVVRVEATYTTNRGTFSFQATPSVPIALALGVNVQDIFKHNALFSRFTVSTSNHSPLRLSKTELIASDMFDSHHGRAPSRPVLVYPKQPATLLYKVSRKAGVSVEAAAKKTMYLKLHYTVLSDEIEAVLRASLSQALQGTPLWECSRLVISRVLQRAKEKLTAYDLERAALLEELPTSLLEPDERQFEGLGERTEADLKTFLQTWQKQHPTLALSSATIPPSSILIPVDIPPVTVVHTADIRLSLPTASKLAIDAHTPVVTINQLVPATLHLKWTRLWDTGDATDSNPTASKKLHSPWRSEDLEFSYEVTAPGDSWLLAGRRKGHFVIPGIDDTISSLEELTSGPDTEADIPLMLVPLREGWLQYPSVEIREVKRAGGEAEDGLANSGPSSPAGIGHCETDYCNLGETVQVISNRARVTLSLDASGPGGGPLVLESERVDLGGRVVA